MLRSSLPLVVPPDVVGLAYGIYEVAENVGKAAGNPLVGYVKDETRDYTIDEVSSLSCAVPVMVIE